MRTRLFQVGAAAPAPRPVLQRPGKAPEPPSTRDRNLPEAQTTTGATLSNGQQRHDQRRGEGSDDSRAERSTDPDSVGGREPKPHERGTDPEPVSVVRPQNGPPPGGIHRSHWLNTALSMDAPAAQEYFMVLSFEFGPPTHRTASEAKSATSRG